MSGHEWPCSLEVSNCLALWIQAYQMTEGIVEPAGLELTCEEAAGTLCISHNHRKLGRGGPWTCLWPCPCRVHVSSHQVVGSFPQQMCTRINWNLWKCRSTESECWKSAEDYTFNKHPQVTLSLRTPVSHVDFKNSCGECFSFLNLKHSLIVSLLRVEKFQEPKCQALEGTGYGLHNCLMLFCTTLGSGEWGPHYLGHLLWRSFYNQLWMSF